MLSARPVTSFAVLAASMLAVGSNDAVTQEIRPAAPVLSMEQARQRSARVSDVAYTLDFSLSAERPEYTGSVEVRFQLSDAEADLTLDFAGGTVRTLAVNGEAADGGYNGYYLRLPARLLRQGPNSVEIGFSRPYSDDGSGLYRFRDPEDGRYYLYSDFEPYDQNRLFPSFDQPDLKARYTTRVTVPADWRVIANVREAAVRPSGDERTWIFPETQPIATYVYALHAGQYHVWEDRAGDIPLRLFARESLVPFVRPDDWFTPTRQGLAFYQSYFDVPYAFGKYDQVIVPHFNSGAMENVGAVTFNEAYLSRGAVTRQNRRTITSVVLHEMAHMWFGDLVTLDWWNGLWLNESFATVMAVISMVEATEFTDEWQESFRDTVRAYRADERDTTHPIELAVPDTDSAFANFDRITYEKGSATLVQLMHLVGPEAFRRGVGNYLRAHAYGNTRIDDFLDAVSQAAGIDLDDWARDWLRVPGANGVAVDLKCSDGRIEGLTLVQSAPSEWPVLRTHRAQLGLYYFGSGVQVETLPVTYAGERTGVRDAEGLACPDLVYANHGDWDYSRVRLAPDALPELGEHLMGFEDAFTRLMLWQSVWDLVADARIPVTDYLDFALANLAAETDEGATRQVLGAIQTSIGYLRQFDASPGAFAEYAPRVEAALWERALASEAGSDRQLLFYDSYVNVASTDAAVERIAGLLAGSQAPPRGVEIDQDRRWTLLRVLAANGRADAPASLLAAERERDPSDEGRRRALAVEAAAPDAQSKRRFIDALLDPEKTASLAEFRAIAGGLFPAGQHDLMLASSQRLLDNLDELSRSRDATFYSAYVGGLLRPICSAQYLERLERRIERADSLHPIIVRGLKDTRFDVARCLRIAEVQAATG